VREGEVVVDAIGTLTGLLSEHEIDRDSYDEQARRKLHGLPERYREEFCGMADVLPVSAENLRLYMFAIGDVTDAIADGSPPAEGCTNIVVAGERTVHSHPLVCKNRDVSGAGIRPQAVVTYPSIGDRHGFVTLSTCGSVLVFQGVNDAGLVAANTFVNVDTDTDTEQEILNGVLVRQILEECSTVADARAFIAGCPLDRIQGLTLVLADGTNAVMLEIDPLVAEVRTISGPIAVRTNHFVGARPDDEESTAMRFVRARELAADLPGEVSRTELFAAAGDHHNGPGPDSICRHGSDDSGPYRLAHSTTVSTTVFRGGATTYHGLVGNPCRSSPVELAVGGTIPDDLRTGQRWRGTLETSP
jgi:hypothetical protein